MQSSLTSVLALALAISAPLASGCSTAPEAETGTLQLPVQIQGSDGALYHLSAAFEITGVFGTVFVDTFDFAPTLAVTLPPGLVSVRLLDGWALERSTDNGVTYAPVSALLGTFNPASFRVLANVTDSVVFQFLVRTMTGELTLRFDVTLQPRELAGGLIANIGTGDFTGYTRARMDYAIYHNLASVDRVTLADGSKQIVFTADAVAAEFFNDPIGLLANSVGPAMAGGFLQYQYVARPDGTQELSGRLDSFNPPFTTLLFGPHVFEFGNLPLDADGFPTDAFFLESFVPFTMTTFFDTGDATLDGQLRFRTIPVSN